MIRAIVAGLFAGLLVVGGASFAKGGAGAHDYPEATSYTVSDDAMGDVDAALERASANGKRVLLVMGANWCHDSRALAGWLESDNIAAMVEREYELVFVNVGMPQRGDGHNLDIARRFGLSDLPGTPNLLVITSNGVLVNADSATTWRNAASRSHDNIYEELILLSDTPAPEKAT